MAAKEEPAAGPCDASEPTLSAEPAAPTVDSATAVAADAAPAQADPEVKESPRSATAPSEDVVRSTPTPEPAAVAAEESVVLEPAVVGVSNEADATVPPPAAILDTITPPSEDVVATETSQAPPVIEKAVAEAGAESAQEPEKEAVSGDVVTGDVAHTVAKREGVTPGEHGLCACVGTSIGCHRCGVLRSWSCFIFLRGRCLDVFERFNLSC